MTEVPGSEWSTEYKEKDELKSAPPVFSPLSQSEREKKHWQKLPGLVRHVFTHFPLELAVYAARVPKKTRAPTGMRFVPLGALDEEALPSVMRKVIAHALEFTPERKTKGRKK